MKLQQRLLPFTIIERLQWIGGQGNPKYPLRIIRDSLFYENLSEVEILRQACRRITGYVISKQIRYRALLKRMTRKLSSVVVI